MIMILDSSYGQYNISIIKLNMAGSKPITHILALIFLFALARSQIQNCYTQDYIIPYDALDDAFDSGIDAIRGQETLALLIENPNAETAKNYALSIAPFSAPLFAMAGITLAIFIGTIIQVICFNSCGKNCCGNEITNSTYNVCCIRVMVAVFLVLSFFVLAISIAALIVNSDLENAIEYTSCNTENIVYSTYNGNNNASIPWSGVNNFQNDINLFAASIQNDIPYLMTYFSSSNTAYNQLIDQTPGSSYANSQAFACQNSNTAVACPFPLDSTGASPCPSTYEAQFNAQFCNTTFNGSAANLIQTQMSQNSTTWRNSTVTMSSSLGSINTQPQTVQTLVNEVTSFTNQIADYQSSLLSGLNQGEDVINKIQIALYVFYAFILFMSLVGMTGVCMTYFCNVFKCRYIMYVLWYMFFLLSFLLFIVAGLFLTSSIFTFDSCLAYPYYFNNATNFKQLEFVQSQLGDIFQVCFFTKNISMFAAFSDTSVLTQFGSLYSQYQSAVPSNKFSTVVTTIQNQLFNYQANPNLVVIQGVNDTLQPQTALNQLNLFANQSAPGTTQSCKLTQDYFTFDVVNCGLYLTNQPVGNNSCVVLVSPNISTIVSGRVSQFNSRSCTTDANTYQNRVNALIQYGNSISSIVNQLSPIPQATTPLQNYEDAYFNYYSNVLNFYNGEIQQTFNTFFNPYVSLQGGSSCGFITSSMNGIVNIACNQLFPYVNTLSALNIGASVFVFIMFLLAYFLTTRFEFYQVLQGNFQNYGAKTYQTKELAAVYDLETTNSRNIQLLQTTPRT